MDDQPKLFGKRIRAIRKAATISQEDAAERAEIHRKYLGEIERGEKRPSFEAILALAKASGTSPAAFFQFEKRNCRCGSGACGTGSGFLTIDSRALRLASMWL